MKLAWVAVLAGYAATPAEERTPAEKAAPRETREELPLELKRKAPQAAESQVSGRNDAIPSAGSTPRTGEGTRGAATPSSPSNQRPVQTSAPQRPAPRPAAADTAITEPQARRFYAIWRESGKTKAMVTEYLENTFGITDDRKIPASRYKEACAWAQQGDRF